MKGEAQYIDTNWRTDADSDADSFITATQPHPQKKTYTKTHRKEIEATLVREKMRYG